MLAFGGMAVLAVVLAMRDNMRGLLTLLSPGYLLFAGWIAATVRAVARSRPLR